MRIYAMLVSSLCAALLCTGCAGSTPQSDVKTALDMIGCEPQVQAVIADKDPTQRDLDVLSLAVCIGKVVAKDMPVKNPADGGALPPKG